MWWRRARAARHRQRPAPVYCFSPRWYSPTAHDCSANCGRVGSPIPRSLVTQCRVSPSVATIRNTFTIPNPGSQAAVPDALTGSAPAGRGGWRSGRTARLAASRARNTQP